MKGTAASSLAGSGAVTEHLVLPNGVPVVVRPRPGAEVTSVSLWVLLGSRHESARTHGITHLLEHVLMQATPPGRRMRVIDELESLGAEANALTARDHLALYARVPTPDALGALRVLADGLANTGFPADLVDAERRVVDEELRLAAADPNDVVHDVFFATAFAGQQVGAAVGGTPASVARLTPADLSGWAERTVRAGTVAAVVSGDVEPVEVAAVLDDGPLGALATRSRAVAEQARPTYGRTDLALNSDTAAVIIGGPGFALDDSRLPAAEVLIELLSGGNASVLHEEIRTNRGLTYDLWGAATGYRDCGVWRIGMSTAPEHRDEVVELAGNLITDALTSGFSAEQVAVARRRVAALLRLDAESSLDEVLRLGQHRLVGQDLSWTLRRHADALHHTEATDVADCARTVLARFVIATAGGSADGSAVSATEVVQTDRREGPWNATLLPVAGRR
jgi:predicted Zn-dependent peptidase